MSAGLFDGWDINQDNRLSIMHSKLSSDVLRKSHPPMSMINKLEGIYEDEPSSIFTLCSNDESSHLHGPS